MKKILLLGGSEQQIVVIEKAKEMGYYTIVCDFLKDNPGQYHANKFYLASTTDKDLILDIAKKEDIDGILAYASDPAAPTAAYVAEKLNLPGNPYKSVDILCDKGKFRKFLKENSFNTPVAQSYDDVEEAIKDINNNYFSFPVIIKPVDSSGSKGVTRLDNAKDARKYIQYALSFSRIKRFIIEEYVIKYGYQVAGDGFSVDGKLVFRCFGNDHFNENLDNPFVPISASFPYNMDEGVHNKIHDEIQRLLSLLHMGTTAYNFDIRIDKDYNVYLMEVAPRNGGNYIPQVIKYATNVDLVKYAILGAMGEKIDDLKYAPVKGCWAYYAVHSLNNGLLDYVDINKEVLEKYVVENHIFKQKGDEINAFTGANTTLGCLVMKFDEMNQMLNMMDHSEEWINVKLLKKQKK